MGGRTFSRVEPPPPLAEPRALCGRCRRPVPVCVCAHLPRLTPRTRVLIVQHPREADVGIGTASMAARCLVGSTLVVGTEVDGHPAVVRALDDGQRPAVLLWPGSDARDLAREAPPGPVTLVVVDGTWSQAKKLLRLNPRLASLPRYGLAPAAPSEYRIRREPSAECLSTIEATAGALGILEGDPARYAAMLTPFRAMVSAQVAYAERHGTPRFLSAARRERRGLWTPPTALGDPARVVLAAIETNAWPFDAKGEHPDEPVHLLALRGDGRARFERVVRPTHPLAPGVSAHTGLEGATILAGVDLGAALEDVRAFVGTGATLATWGSYAADWLRRLVPSVATLDLRRTAADWLRATPGSIEACVARLGLAPAPLGPGRAGRRLAHLVAVYQAILGPRPPRPPPPVASPVGTPAGDEA